MTYKHTNNNVFHTQHFELHCVHKNYFCPGAQLSLSFSFRSFFYSFFFDCLVCCTKERSAPKISSLLAHTRSPSCIHYSYSTSCQTSRTNHPRRPFLVLRHPCPRLIIGGPVPVYPVCPTQRDAIWAQVRKNLREKRQESGG